MILLLFLQSSTGTIRLPDVGFDWFDKVVHFFVFGVLGLFMARGLKNSDYRKIRDHFFKLSMIVSIFYGALDEVHQYFVPGRYASVWDWIADTLGIILAVSIYKYILKRKHN
ncbi:MAG: VanZ family protein [Calditrichales bacterium]|nr:MAG: VanZ family protein [Calditrichales bacterium]